MTNLTSVSPTAAGALENRFCCHEAISPCTNNGSIGMSQETDRPVESVVSIMEYVWF